jgi:hypothetical protein
MLTIIDSLKWGKVINERLDTFVGQPSRKVGSLTVRVQRNNLHKK